MSNYPPLPIHCSNCGDTVMLEASWFNSLTRARVCGAECNEELSKKYAKMIVDSNKYRGSGKSIVVWPDDPEEDKKEKMT